MLKSWDRFAITFPFSRGIFLWGEPIEVPKELDEAGVEQIRLHVQAAMVEQAAEAFFLWRGVRPPSAQVLAELREVLKTESAH